MKNLRFLKYVGFGILGVGFIFLAIFVTMSLWNWLIPLLFHGPVITFWQTAGLFLLSKILLTGVAPGSHSNKYKRDWHNRYHEKYRSCRDEESTEPAGETV
jgi:sterol desaturase/sphingolipid hydroxylase (fatty acid hydroxylase superfamily)